MSLRVLHSVKEVLELLTRKARLTAKSSIVYIDESHGLISAKDVVSPMDIPPTDRSVLDGYAVKWTDVSGATEASPVTLKIKCSIPVGSSPESCGNLEKGTAAAVATGSPLPGGADAVVPLEYTKEINGYVQIFRPVPGGYGVSVKGEDLKKGDIIISRGDVIRAWHVAILASLGISRVEVLQPLRAAVFSTGDELIEPWKRHEPGKVYSSTGRLVVNWLRSRGIDAEYLGTLPDSSELISRKFQELLDRGYDIVLSTGGTSVGRRDHSVKALAEVADDYVHGIALTPGRPGAFGVSQGRVIAALSGMPIAALSELIAVFEPFYLRVIGRHKPWDPEAVARLRRNYTSHPGLVNIVRSITCYNRDGALQVTPLRVTGSGILSTLLKGNSYFIVEEEVTGIEAGEPVTVRIPEGILWRCRE